MITFVLAVCGNVDYIYTFPQSPPSRAAWIEIYTILHNLPFYTSPPSRAAWIEITPLTLVCGVSLSPPSRAAWIEITVSGIYSYSAKVAAFTGGVD